MVRADGVSHPVEVVWAPPATPVRPPHGMRVDPALLTHVASVVRAALAEREGDVLCFLPGVGEIGRVAGQLGAIDAEVLQVHGQAPSAVQDAVLAGSSGGRRVVLATAVAESSLTVPGVRVVVDAGLAREPRTDHARGLGALTTVRVSRAAARQRAGRAGREAPGAVYRCWPQAEDARAARFPSPEIKVADLAAFALQAACWGDPDASGLALLDPPPAGALAAARTVLTAIGAVDGDGRPTARGVRMARLGLHPRLARALLDGAGAVGARRAAEIVALLSEEPPRAYGDDLAAAWRTARRGQDAYAARWRQETRRLTGRGGGGGYEAKTSRMPRTPGPLPSDGIAAHGLGRNGPWADGLRPTAARGRRAHGRRRCRAGGGARLPRAGGAGHGPRERYLMVSGTGGELADGVGAARRDVAGGGGRGPAGHGGLRADPAGGGHRRGHGAGGGRRICCAEGEEVRWQDGDVVARRVERLGAVELSARGRWRHPDPRWCVRRCWTGCDGRAWGCCAGPGTPEELRERLGFLHRALGGNWPDVSDDGAAGSGPTSGWSPSCPGPRRRSDLGRIDAGQALRRLLPWATR